MRPLVSLLILTYNRPDLLKACLKSAVASDYPNLQFIISDNGQMATTQNLIRREFSDVFVKVVSAGRNVGLTGGFNYGFKYCRALLFSGRRRSPARTRGTSGAAKRTGGRGRGRRC